MARVKLEWVLVAMACVCPSSCAPTGAPEVVARSSSTITNGAADTSDEGVVAIVDASGATWCSGTLVAPHIVLTAAHCTPSQILQGARAVFGPSLASAAASVPIVRAVAHPQFDESTFANDVAVLVLASAGPVPPVRMAASAPNTGATVRLVGWGRTAGDAGDDGQKRQGTSTVGAVTPTTFAVGPIPSQPCEGDSGGPALATANGIESVVGVTSHGDTACVQGATYARVDAFLDSFIQPTMARFAEGSAASGAPCLFPEQCAGGAPACVVAPDDPNLSYCTAACRENSECPAAMVCVPVGDAGTECRYPVPTPGAYGAACSSDADCDEGQCTTTGVCALRCVPTDPACPPGFACTNTADVDFFCIRSPPAAKGAGCMLAPPGRAAPLTWLAAAVLALRVARRGARRR